MLLHFELKNKDVSFTPKVNVEHNTYILDYPCEDECSVCSPYFTQLPRGSYILEVWGGQGGLSGGKGGYSKGILRLSETTPTYIYIGSKGCELKNTLGITKLAFGGGGSGSAAHSSSSPRSAGSGGGGTDIRINSDDLNNRIIVAGGGGGVSYSTNPTNDGGYGGGIKGEDVEVNNHCSKGGTQENSPEVASAYSGSFGVGGTSNSNQSTASGGGGADLVDLQTKEVILVEVVVELDTYCMKLHLSQMIIN